MERPPLNPDPHVKAEANRKAYEHEMRKANKRGLVPVHMLHGKEKLIRQREIRMAGEKKREEQRERPPPLYHEP